MDLQIHRPVSDFPGSQMHNSMTADVQALCTNLENHLGNKVKVSFLPNQYYNEKIYILMDYIVHYDKRGINLSLKLKEGDIKVEFRLDEVVRIESNEYFNRIEYKAYKSHSDFCKEIYNFCLYY